MKLHSQAVALSLFFAACFIQTAAGIQCDSFCAACWKIDSPGVDIKIRCGAFGNCPYPCPSGYNNIHCANSDRCWWVDLLIYITISFSSRVGVFQWTNKHSQIGARNLIVRYLARVIVESTTVKTGGKAAKYRIQARSVQIDSFLFFCFVRRVQWLRDLQNNQHIRPNYEFTYCTQGYYYKQKECGGTTIYGKDILRGVRATANFLHKWVLAEREQWLSTYSLPMSTVSISYK